MPYNNIRVHNYGNNEQTPLTVGSAASTDGTFSTITLDSTLVRNSRTTNGNSNSNNSNDSWSPTASRCHLLIFLLLYLAIGLWAANIGIWWVGIWSAVLVYTGTNSLVADDRSEGTHRCTLYTWFLSAACATGLFAYYFCRAGGGEGHILWWCLVYASERYAPQQDYSTVPLGVCASLSNDGTLEKIRIGIIVAGIVLGLPLVALQLRVVHNFYFDARKLNRILPR